MQDVIIVEKPPSVIPQGKILQYCRPDGFTVFFDGDAELDAIRETADKRAVIVAVACRRAQQIARNYARKYAPELLKNFTIKKLQ